jgi:hypothetical protein
MADRAAGHRYDISILQAKLSLAQMLDKPVSGQIFFEQVIRDNLDLAGYASTASSSASRTPTATRSTPPARATPCTSPPSTTVSASRARRTH